MGKGLGEGGKHRLQVYRRIFKIIIIISINNYSHKSVRRKIKLN